MTKNVKRRHINNQTPPPLHTPLPQTIAETSVVSFVANSLQSRIVSTEISTRLAKVYEVGACPTSANPSAGYGRRKIGGL